MPDGRKERILDYLHHHKAEQGIAPTIREIGAACGISSTSVVSYWLDRLERDGFIKRYRDVSRGIVLLYPGGTP